jgi:protein involved in polysaccharide export with SLBB domain
MLARSTAAYRVTAGDVYTLTYAAGGTAVVYVITVDSTYRIRVSNLGTVNGAGKTFVRLKEDVEAIVSNNYPLSGVQLTLTQAAVFLVHVKGEVETAGEVNAWGLDRLSSIAQKNLTPYSSIRNVTVRSSGGQVREYDLYKAQRDGDLSQDPYLRPGDEITFKRVNRAVKIMGEVERPGTYQLKEGENLKELITVYGGGFTAVADRTRIEIVRMVGSESVSGDKLFVNKEDVEGNYEVKDYDEVNVPTIVALRPVIFVEGAVNVVITEKSDSATTTANATATSATTAVSSTTTEELTGSTRLVVAFNRGEDYAALVRRNILWFRAESDTRNAYLIRGGERILINLNPMLYDVEYRSELKVEENDTLVIPFRQYFVTVAGAVVTPGRYPYIPDREWDYYVGLAGGFVMGKNAREAIKIQDMSGKEVEKGVMIEPEMMITAKTNDPLYYFNQYAPVFTTALSIVSTFISILLLVK